MRDFSKVRRVVIKAGTNLLSSQTGIDENRIKNIVEQISALKDEGYQVILVSSGAVGLGAKALGHTSPVVYITMKQACAAIGQPLLMSAYRNEFARHNLLSAQVLITRSILNNRKSYNNLRASVSTLLAMGIVPIFPGDTPPERESAGDIQNVENCVRQGIVFFLRESYNDNNVC